MSLSVVFMSSCKSNEKEEDSMTPEKFMEEMYTNIANGSETLDDVYVNRFSLNSSKSITLDEYEQLFEDVTIKGIKNVSSKLVDYPGDPVYEVDFTLTYDKDGTEYSAEYTDYVIYTFKTYKYLYKGYLNRKYYDMAQTNDTNDIHCESISIYNSVNGKEINLVMINETKDNYSLGYQDAGIKMIINTDSGLLMQIAEKPVYLKSNTKESVTLRFDDPFDKIGKISITRIYKLDEKNIPINSGDGIEYSVRVNE